MDHLIRREKPASDAVELDVLFVGGGPAGLSGAIELARLIKEDPAPEPRLKDIQIGVLEKAQALGEHNLSGAILDPAPLRALFPKLRSEEFPFEGTVAEERVYILSERKRYRLPTPPPMRNEGNVVVSICELVRWLGRQAEERGIHLLTGFPADSLLVEENRVLGVRTTPAGLTRSGEPGSAYLPPTDIRARAVVLAEGTRGALTQAYLRWQRINSPNPQIYALGVKELWRVRRAPEAVIHTLGWPLPKDAFGGSWMYPMRGGLLSFGLVVGLDYPEANLDVHDLVQKFKEHPFLHELLKGGELLEWGAKTIPEGGFFSIPRRLSGDGLLIIGDAAGLVSVASLKGIHYAVHSGVLAARTIFRALKEGDTSHRQLRHYDEMLNESFVIRDLYHVRNMRLAFKSGLYKGGIKAGLMSLVGDALQGPPIKVRADNYEPRESARSAATGAPGLTKSNAVFYAGNQTRDDIPVHLRIGRDIPPEVAEFYSHVCPAGVYERAGSQLIVNAPNCIDCKATDVLGPRWLPREGGSGPRYKKM